MSDLPFTFAHDRAQRPNRQDSGYSTLSIQQHYGPNVASFASVSGATTLSSMSDGGPTADAPPSGASYYNSGHTPGMYGGAISAMPGSAPPDAHAAHGSPYSGYLPPRNVTNYSPAFPRASSGGSTMSPIRMPTTIPGSYAPAPPSQRNLTSATVPMAMMTHLVSLAKAGVLSGRVVPTAVNPTMVASGLEINASHNITIQLLPTMQGVAICQVIAAGDVSTTDLATALLNVMCLAICSSTPNAPYSSPPPPAQPYPPHQMYDSSMQARGHPPHHEMPLHSSPQPSPMAASTVSSLSNYATTTDLLSRWSSFSGSWDSEVFRESADTDIAWLMSKPAHKAIPSAWTHIVCKYFDGQRGHLVSPSNAKASGEKVVRWLEELFEDSPAPALWVSLALARAYYVTKRGELNQTMIIEHSDIAEGHTTSASKLRKHQRYCAIVMLSDCAAPLYTAVRGCFRGLTVTQHRVLTCKILFGSLLSLAMLHAVCKKTCYFEPLLLGAAEEVRVLPIQIRRVDAGALTNMILQLRRHANELVCGVSADGVLTVGTKEELEAVASLAEAAKAVHAAGEKRNRAAFEDSSTSPHEMMMVSPSKRH